MVGIFGSVDALAEDYLAKGTVEKIVAMPEGPGKESAKIGAGIILPELKRRVSSDELKGRIETAISKLSGNSASAAGRRRKTKRSNVKSRSRRASRSSGLRSSKA